MEEQLAELERRVAFLEEQTGECYEEHAFERTIDSITPDDADVDSRDGRYGYFAQVTNIDGDEAQEILREVEKRDGYGSALTETGNGLGVEVWTDARI